MSSTYSTSLRIELQGSGENSGTWGTITNNNFSQSLEFSIAGIVNVACGDSAVTTLTNADGPQSQANNQARNAHIRLTGAHGAVRIAQFPATQKVYLITNATTDSGSSGPYAMTVRLGAFGNTLSIANGATRLVATDGTNWYDVFAGPGTVTAPVDLNGQTLTLDADADGYVRGEACGALCISRHDGEDDLLLVTELVGSAVNQDGRSSALTAPNGPAQQNVITSAADNAALSLRGIAGFQLHGTGTPLGDPIEIGALSRVLSLRTKDTTDSVSSTLLLACKTCVGHTESAAGITGLIMTLSTVERKMAHSILHLRSINVHLEKMLISKKSSNAVTTPCYTLPRQSAARSSLHGIQNGNPIGTSSFAYQGTNAHVLMTSPDSASHQYALSFQTVLYQSHRYWILPLTHSLMSHVELRNDAGSHIICMASKLERPVLDWICDHQVMGRIVCPGAAYMEMSACVSEVCNGSMGTELASLVSDASIPMPLTLAKPKETQNTLIADCTLSILMDVMDGSIQIRSSSSAQGGSGLHLRAFVGVRVEDHDIDMPFSMSDGTKSASISPEMVRSQCCQSVDNAFMYASLRAVGLQYGPSFQVASRVNVHPDGTRVLGLSLIHI